MTSIWKRSLSMFLAVIMVVGMLPVNAFATESVIVEELLVEESVETESVETPVVENDVTVEDEPLIEEEELVEEDETEEVESDETTDDETQEEVEEIVVEENSVSADAMNEAVTVEGTIDSEAELAAALAVSGEYVLGGTIDVTDVITVPENVTVTLNLGEFALNVGEYYIENNGTLTIQNGSLVADAINDPTNGAPVLNKGNLTLNADLTGVACVVRSEGGSVTINDGTYTMSGYEGYTCNLIRTKNGADVTILDGTFDGTAAKAITRNGSNFLSASGCTTAIYGGTFQGFNVTSAFTNDTVGALTVYGGTFAQDHTDNWSVQGKLAPYVPEGYDIVVNDEDTWVTVQEHDYAAFIGTQGFESLQAAINEASTTETTTITLIGGSHDGDVNITIADVGEQKADLIIQAAEGADVTITGTVTLGYYEKRVGATAWNAAVTFEGITFDHAESAKHSIDVQSVKGFALNNCNIVGDGEYGIGSSAGNNTTNSSITGCTFTNAGMQVLGNFGTGLVIDDCTFNDSRINVQGGNLVTVQNSTFNASVTDANVGDSFYLIRSNDNKIVVEDTTFNIDSTVTGTAADQTKWGIFWARNVGSRKWELTDIKVNMTESALAQTELMLFKNGTTNSANEADRFTVTDLTSSSNNVADLLAKGEGTVQVVANGVKKAYVNGVWTKPAPTGSITAAYTNSTRFWGEGGGNAYESLVVELYEGETKIGSASLNNYENIIDGDVYVTWGIPFDGQDSEYWDVEWAEGYPKSDMAPDKVVMIIDGTVVAENVVKMNAPDDLNKIVAYAEGAQGNFIGYYAGFESALAAAAENANIARLIILEDIVQTTVESTSYYDIAQALTICAPEGETRTISINPTGDSVAVRVQGNSASLTIAENVTIDHLDVVANGFATTGENMIIDGTLKALSLKQWSSNGTITVSETGKVWLGFGDGQFDMAYGNGTVTINGNKDKTEAQFKAGYSGTRGDGNTLNLKDTYFEAGAWFDVNGSNGTFNVDNSVLKVSGGDNAGRLAIASTGNTINLTNGSALEAANITLGESNTITMDKTSSIAATKITGAGTISVDITGMEIGDTINITADLSEFTGAIEAAGNEDLKFVVDEDGKVVLKEKVYVAQLGEKKFESLQAAIDAVQEGDTITLLCDVNVTEAAYGENALNHARAVGFTLDLGSNTLSADTGNSVLRFNIANSGATSDVVINIVNGTIISGENTWCAVMASGTDDAKAVMNLENLTIENNKGGDFAVKAWGNGVVNANNVTINASYGGGFYAVGGEIVLDNCTVDQKGLWTAPYNSMAFGVSNGGKMTVNSGSYTAVPAAAADGYNQGTSHGSWLGGIMSSGGTLVINGGTFTNGNVGGTASNPRELLIIGADADYGDNVSANLIINGGTFNSIGALTHCETIWGSETDSSNTYMPTMAVTITGGNFTGVVGKTIGGCDPVSTGNPVEVEINGGTYGENHAIDQSYLAEGYVVKKNADGTFGIGAEHEAMIFRNGVKYYSTLADAIADAKEGETVTVIANVTVTSPITIDKNITIADYGQLTVTFVDDGCIHLVDNTALTLDQVIMTAPVYADSSVVGATVNGNVVTGVVDQMSTVVSDGTTVTVTNPDWVAANGDVYYMSITEAIKAAEAGDTVTIFAGEYTENVSINKAITVIGETDAEGNNLVKINGGISITADGAAVKNLTASNPATSGYNMTLSISAGDVLIEGCEITDHNAVRYSKAKGLVTFKDSILTGSAYGIHFDGDVGGEIVIDGCTITGWTSFASTIDKVTVNDSEFLDGNYNQLRFYQNAELNNVTFNPNMTIDFGKDDVDVAFNDCEVSDGSDLQDVIYLPDLAKMGVDVTIDGEPVIIVAMLNDTVCYQSIDEAFADAKNGDTISVYADVTMAKEYDVNGMTLTIDGTGKLTLNDKLTVHGESTLNISAPMGGEVILGDGAILKDSTISGDVFVAGNVTFRGDNTVGMLYDFGTLVSNYGAEANMEWTVEPGASLTLSSKSRYGLGYGDNINVKGNLTDALTARETLTENDMSLFMHGISMSSYDSYDKAYLTVEDAYVTIGSNSSFGTKVGNSGEFAVSFKNSVLDASRITIYSTGAKSTFDFTDSDIKVGTFMTRDADSVFTLTNSVLLSTTTFNGNDAGNYHAGKLVLSGSALTYSAPLVMENGTIEMDMASTITAPSVTGAGTITIDATGFSGEAKTLIAADMSAFEGEIEVIGAVYEATEDGLVVKSAAAKIGDTCYETLEEAFDSIGAGDVVIELLNDASMDYNAREAFGAGATTSVTINGNGHTMTLNQKNSDWSSFGLANCAKLVLNNMTVEKTGYGDTSGAWNTHAINFTCPVEMNDVTVNNSMSVEAGAELNNVTINEANGYYGLWIDGNGQTVTVNGGAINATNGGRGIKIADEYVDSPASVTLNVDGTDFNTAKKAAVLVSSTAGAEITAEGFDISGVAEDTVNFVWVDEDWAAYYNNVKVYGDATKTLEGIAEFLIEVKDEDGNTLSYYKTLDALFADTSLPNDDLTVTLYGDVVAEKQVDTSDSQICYNFVSGVDSGVTMTFEYADNWNSVRHMSIGKGVTLNANNYLSIYGGVFDIYGTVNTGYAFATAGAVTVKEGGVLNVTTGDKTIQVKNNSWLEVYGTVNAGTVNVWNNNSRGSHLIVSGANAQLNAEWVHAWNNKSYTVTNEIVIEKGATLTTTGLQADRGSEVTVDAATLTADTLTLGYEGNIGTLTVKNDGVITNGVSLNSTTSTVTGPEGMNVTTSIADHKVVYEDGVYKVVAKVYIVQVGENKYEYLDEAVETAEDGATVTLLSNATGAGVVIDKNVTIDLNTFTYTVNKCVGSAGTATLGFQILKGNDVTITNGTLAATTVTEGKPVKVLVQNYANLTLSDVTLDGTGSADMQYVLSNNSGDVSITGETNITAPEGAVAFDVYDYSSAGYTAPVVKVDTTGKITGKIEVSETATLAISSGIYTVVIDKSWCAEGFVPTSYTDDTYGVMEAEDATVMIGDMSYASLAEAAKNAKDGDEIVITAGQIVTETAVIGADVTINLNGKTLTGHEDVYPIIRVVDDVNVIIDNGTITNEDYIFVLGAMDGTSAGNLTIKGGSYHGDTTVASVTKGVLTIEGGEFSVDAYDGDGYQNYNFLLNCIDANYNDGSAQILVKGGSFENFNPADNAAEGLGTNFLADGYKAVTSNGSVWNVVEIDHIAEINGKAYDTVAAALADAKSGDNVTVVADSTEGTLMVTPGVTLDLNGYTVAADYVIGLNGSHVVDNTRTGLLKVASGSVSLSTSNSETPVRDNELGGYRFGSYYVNDTDAGLGVSVADGVLTYSFVAKHSGKLKSYILDGVSDNEIQVVVKVTWTEETGERSQLFVYNDAQVGKVAGGGYRFTFNLTGYENLQDLKINAMITTDSRAENSTDVHVVN